MPKTHNGKEKKREKTLVLLAKFSFTAAALFVFFSVFKTHYLIGIDDQRNPCLGHHLYFVDLKGIGSTPVKGDAYAFKVRVKPLNGTDTKEIVWAKRLAASAGDTVEITKEGALFINGTRVRDSLPLASLLHKKPEEFAMKRTLSGNELFFLGDTFTSYDSRYWGTVDKTQLQGKVIGGFF